MKCINPNCNNFFNGIMPKYCEDCGQVQILNDNLHYKAIGDKNIISSTSTTIHNNNIEDDTKKIIICAISGKRIFLKDSIKCLSCNLDISSEYFIFEKIKCKKCYENDLTKYKSEVEFVLIDQIIDPSERVYLNQIARELNIDSDTQLNIEFDVKNNIHGTKFISDLEGLHKIDFEIAKKDLFLNLNKISAFERLSSLYEKYISNEEVCNLYFFSYALVNPDDYILNLKFAKYDIFWQQYWGYLANILINEKDNSFESLIKLKKIYNSRGFEIQLAEAVLYFKIFLLNKEFEFFKESKNKLFNLNIDENNVLYPLYLSTKILIDNFNETKEIFEYEKFINSQHDSFQFYFKELYKINELLIQSNDNLDQGNTILFSENIDSQDIAIDFKNSTLLNLSKIDNTPFITLGRSEKPLDNLYLQINDKFLSRTHCKIRLLTSEIFEIVDLSSTNGTIVNDLKLNPHISYFFHPSCTLLLGNSCKVDIMYIYEKIKRVNIFKNYLNNVKLTSFSISNSGKSLTLPGLINISKEYYELSNKSIFTRNLSKSTSIVDKVFGYNKSQLLSYFLSIKHEKDVIFIDQIEYDSSKTILPSLTYNEMFKKLHICYKCKKFVDKQILNDIICQNCLLNT